VTKWSNKPGSCTIDKILYQQQDRVEKHPDLPTLLSPASRLLSTADFLRLCEVPAETAWFANIDNLQTRRDYQNMLEDFMKFTGIKRPDEFREISPAWRVIGLILAAPSFGPSATTALLEAAKGALVLLVGFGLLSLVNHDVQRAAEHLIAHAHLNPASRYPHIFIDVANQLTDTCLLLIAAGGGAYSLGRFIEAYGLWHAKRWAQWFAARKRGDLRAFRAFRIV